MKIIEFKGNEVVQTPSRKRYEIGSQTKMFTALSIYKAVESGKLNLDDKVSKYVDSNLLSFDHKATNKTYDVSNNTIKELLGHEIKCPDLINWGKDVKDIDIYHTLLKLSVDLDTDEGIMHLIENVNTASEEHIQESKYNNTGYWLLGKVIEKVYGASYEQVIEQEIIKPLNMTQTNWDNSDVKGSIDGNVHRFSTKLYGPAGGLVSSYEDMNKFILGMKTLIKPETMKLWKEYALTRKLGAGLINLNQAVKKKHTLKGQWWGHSGQTLQMQSASFVNESEEVILASTDDATVGPIKTMLEEMKK